MKKEDADRYIKIISTSVFPQKIKRDGCEFDAFGLARRELYAIIAMGGILSNINPALIPSSDIAKWAVEQADLLIKELEKEV